MDISKLTIEELLTLRHQISSRISTLRQNRKETIRGQRRTVLQQRAQSVRSQLHNGDMVFFRLGLQSYKGTVRRKAEKNAAIEFYDQFAKEHKSHYVPYHRILVVRLMKGEQMPITGNVYWIERGVQTIKVVDAEYAFRDPDQAKAQVQFAEASGNKKQIRLTRLAFRQYQGTRYRGEKKGAAEKEIKPRAKPSKKTAGGKAPVRKGRTKNK